MRDRQFYVDSIKMDLYRVVTAVGNLENPIPYKSVEEFIDHALLYFDKVVISKRETELKLELEALKDKLNSLVGSHNRLCWAEKVLTIRCRL